MRPTAVLSSKRICVLAALIVGLSAALTIVFWGADEESATATPPQGAVHSMSAMSSPETRLIDVPTLVKRLPGDMAARPGTVRRLASGLGKSGFSLYAWPGANGESVCYVSSSAGGGCFPEFRGPFNISITDFDRLGSGKPLTVSGPVRDGVVGIEVIVNGKPYEALVNNNVAFLEVPDPTALPSDIERVTATLEDGTKEPVRL